MRKWEKERATRILGPREEKEEIKEEGKTEIGDGNSSTMPNSPTTGLVWGEARTGLATACSSEEEANPLNQRKKM